MAAGGNGPFGGIVANLHPVWQAARSLWRVSTPAGRATLAVGVVAWLAGARLGWQELFLVAACCALFLVAAVIFVVGTPSLDVAIEVDPPRVTVGGTATGKLIAVNRTRRRLRQLAVELPVAGSRLVCQLPWLARGASQEVTFDLPADRRAVIQLGPGSAVRSDPLGLLRRDAASSQVAEFFVHPKIVPLDSLSPGLQRDLEGQATRDLSTSDLAFHTLRDYVTGDDRRHVHWRSSAKAGRLLVRQFQDTRRSQLTVLVDGAAASYRSTDEFELALSVAGSIGVRAVTDQQDIYLVAASHAVNATRRERVLDTLSRAELTETGQDLAVLAARASRMALDTTVLMLLTGSVISFRALKSAAVYFGPDVRVLALRAEPDSPPGVTRSADITVLGLRALTDLPALLTAGAA